VPRRRTAAAAYQTIRGLRVVDVAATGASLPSIAEAATAVPQRLQKRPPSGIRLPHFRQSGIGERELPQAEQNRPLAALPQAGHFLGIIEE